MADLTNVPTEELRKELAKRQRAEKPPRPVKGRGLPDERHLKPLRHPHRRAPLILLATLLLLGVLYPFAAPPAQAQDPPAWSGVLTVRAVSTSVITDQDMGCFSTEACRSVLTNNSFDLAGVPYTFAAIVYGAGNLVVAFHGQITLDLVVLSFCVGRDALPFMAAETMEGFNGFLWSDYFPAWEVGDRVELSIGDSCM